MTISVDDILIYTKTIDDHLDVLERVFKRLEESNIIINLKKCEILKSKINYLGFEIDGIAFLPDRNSLENLKPWKIPKTRRLLQKLLGEINWYSRFIPNISSRISNLYDKLKSQNRKLKISNEEMIPVQEIYESIKKQANFYIPELNTCFENYSDPSDKEIGAVFLRNSRVIEYFSKKYTDIETRCSTTEKEILAIFKAVLHWKNLIGGSEIRIYTDNKNHIYDTYKFDKKIEIWKAVSFRT